MTQPVPTSKMITEALCTAQSALTRRAAAGTDTDRVPQWIAHLQELIYLLERHEWRDVVARLGYQYPPPVHVPPEVLAVPAEVRQRAETELGRWSMRVGGPLDFPPPYIPPSPYTPRPVRQGLDGEVVQTEDMTDQDQHNGDTTMTPPRED